jgi:SAM-dependent methyltransferase
MNRESLFKIYWKLESRIVPTLKYSQTIYEEVLNENSRGSPIWLDVGCGHNLLPPWRLEQERQLIEKQRLVVGIDYDLLSLTKHKTITDRVRCGIAELPFANDTFDLVTANMVFEHLDDPGVQLKEIARVLKRGGRLILHTPNVFGYGTIAARMIPEFIKARIIYILHGRDEEDIFVAHYRMNSPSTITRLAKSADFNVSSIRMICSSAQFAVLPPLAFLELLWIKLLMTRTMKPFRTNMIAVLEKT